jgi:hypothetical protein
MFGSIGNEVRKLQEGLNTLPSQLAKLVADGQFGPKTQGRVKEFQSKSGLVADGIVGPLTWEKLLALLAQASQGGVPVMPAMNASVFDALRPLVLTIAQQHMGKVDFSQMVLGRPRGIDFIKEVFQFAANVPLTDANFVNAKGAWDPIPWVGLKTQQKSWCGIFAAYCYRKAGIPVSWDIGKGGPVGPIELRKFGPDFASSIKPGDIGAVATQNHHFLIETVGPGALPKMESIDGNTEFGRIQRRNKHKVGTDNFNYYRFTQ